jgi:hypothetical protein
VFFPSFSSKSSLRFNRLERVFIVLETTGLHTLPEFFFMALIEATEITDETGALKANYFSLLTFHFFASIRG